MSDYQFEYNNIPLIATFAFTENSVTIYDIHREDTDQFVDSLTVHPLEEVQAAVATWKSQAAKYVL